MTNEGAEAPSPEALLKALEHDEVLIRTSFERAGVFGRAAALFHDAGDSVAARRAGLIGLLFRLVALRRNVRAENDGERFVDFYYRGEDRIPAPLLEAATLDLFEESLRGSSNPVHRARYADYLWVRRGDYRHAVEAADAYLTAAPVYAAREWTEDEADALERAAELALTLSDTRRAELAKEACFRAAGRLLRQDVRPDAPAALEALTTLQIFRRPGLSGEDHERVVALAEEAIQLCEAAGDLRLQREYLQLLPQSLEKLGRQTDAQRARERRAESLEREAAESDSNLVALRLYQEAAQAYGQAGMADKVKAVKRRLTEVGTAAEADLHPITVEMAVPRAALEEWVIQLSRLDLDEALDVLARTRRFVPRLEDVVKTASERRANHPIQYMVSRMTLDDRGRIVSSTGERPEHAAEEQSIADAYAFALTFRGMELSLAFDVLEAERGLKCEHLEACFRRAPLISSATQGMISVGLERYFAQDYVSALHVLTPHLEEAIRGVLPLLGEDTRSIHQGATREKPLEEVLRVPQLRAVLSEDLSTYLQSLLVDRRHINLRNAVAHGLLTFDNCTRARAQSVIHALLMLTSFVVVPAAMEEVGEAEQSVKDRGSEEGANQ